MNELFDKMSVKFKTLDGNHILWFGFRKENDKKTFPG